MSKTNNWTIEELEASVVAYIEMRQRNINGEKFKKQDYYKDLTTRFDRTIKAFEYRMQNISYVYSLMGREWLTGLRPAKNVGARVAGEIETIINKLEGQTLSKIAIFETNVESLRDKGISSVPQGNTTPTKSETIITQYNRDPAIVAWVLNNANGICECCKQPSPFVKENNIPFLEVHHLQRLADNGSDTTTNAIALCPNCHRELHYGQNKKELENNIYLTISRLVKN